ncbi:MAG: DUF192 domain-containing protein [Spirochaetaceae bacterium]|jgi:uncharacterized membrane protein (UPF0127 family)|nr:DUF192 domain-containing protein [Spirochaetaceae bacterium]
MSFNQHTRPRQYWRRPKWRILWFAALCVCAGRLAAAPEDTRPQPKLETRLFTIEKAGGETVHIDAELARTETERSRGLMFRKKLAGGSGMLFVYDRDDRLSFWMKNTSIPLSIAFISKTGEIIDILNMTPYRTTPVQSSRSVRYALEVPQGWFTQNGIQTGDRLNGLPL